MVYLYIDESGDLGFSGKGSEYFIFTCVKIEDDNTNTLFKRIPKKIRQRTLKKRVKKLSELKFSNSSILIRERFLKRVADLDIKIYSLIIEKKYTQERLKENLPVLYNYLLKIILEKLVFPNNKINICLDKCMSSTQRENFENYIKTDFLYKFGKIPDLKIIHENSNCNEALQVIDFICGAFGYKYNTSRLKGDFDKYIDIIKLKIIEERNDFFKEK
jgi:hypothetical protein